MLTAPYTPRRAVVDCVGALALIRAAWIVTRRVPLPPQDGALNGDFDKLTEEERAFVGVRTSPNRTTGANRCRPEHPTKLMDVPDPAE